ncbi:GSCOCG00001955001-RA-CDS [Cotesia congregata]|uniref:Similar to tmem201: Transmembrane protein 201 (Danio rerio) n=1 Tax=Cotesia congregata TaxID=51543 RepID=A0A8J2N0C3_COTCN|nr:GSCOCG00001955001-RA-CDS [Cotesia congregata]CAG5108874.1 Similar to tmem201: Transmembrane protein 201 (Danio rerio) [Cotesia congregata]
MEIDMNLMINFVPIIATILALTIASFVVIQGLKQRWPKTLNCWFCSANSKICRTSLDWWKCPSCHQYNGFSKDGDYKYDIPEQRSRSLNKPAGHYSSGNKNQQTRKTNGLCKKCNSNEELKVIELRSIDPLRWRPSEVESFKQSLDEKYPLCKKCNSFVKKVIQKQTHWLMQYKMLFFKQRSMEITVKHKTMWEKLCRTILTFLSAGIIYYPTNQQLSIIGALLQLVTVTRVHITKRNFDLLLTLIWVGICILMPFSNIRLLKLKFKIEPLDLEYITGYGIIAILSSVLGFINLTSNNPSNGNVNISFKKLESPIASINTVHKELNNAGYCNQKNSIDTSIHNQKEYCNKKLEKDVSVRKSLVNTTHLLMTDTSFDSPATIKASMSPYFRICESQRSSISNEFTPKNINVPTNISFKGSPEYNHKNPEKYALNESLKTLSNLSLDSNHKQTSKNSQIFETKTYGTSSPDLFRRNYRTSQNKFILAPPKLKSVTQTSWVAGGYWQMGMDSPTLSRSSSQSSGFGSTASNLGPSREPSVLNEVDRCSVVSEVLPCYNAQRQTSVGSANSFCQHGPTYRVATPDFTGCMGTSHSPPPNLIIATPCNQSFQQQSCHNYHINDQCTNGNISYNMVPQTPQISCNASHPISILNSPIWLPALLCGSIVFNMVVFCTVLLR